MFTCARRSAATLAVVTSNDIINLVSVILAAVNAALLTWLHARTPKNGNGK